MATEAQIAANRRNAQRSTGPRTAAGKVVTRMNAVKSGLYAKSLVIRTEKPADLDQLAAEYHAEFHPVTPRERDLVDTLVHNQWLIRRLRRTEADLHARHYAGRDQDFDGRWSHHIIKRDHPLADAFDALEKQLVRLQTRVNALERSSRHTLKELRDLRARPVSEIGFVPSEPPQPAPSAPDPQASEPQSPSASSPSATPIGFVSPQNPQPAPPRRGASPNPSRPGPAARQPCTTLPSV